jgi:hypothetical protein
MMLRRVMLRLRQNRRAPISERRKRCLKTSLLDLALKSQRAWPAIAVRKCRRRRALRIHRESSAQSTESAQSAQSEQQAKTHHQQSRNVSVLLVVVGGRLRGTLRVGHEHHAHHALAPSRRTRALHGKGAAGSFAPVRRRCTPTLLLNLHGSPLVRARPSCLLACSASEAPSLSLPLSLYV